MGKNTLVSFTKSCWWNQKHSSLTIRRKCDIGCGSLYTIYVDVYTSEHEYGASATSQWHRWHAHLAHSMLWCQSFGEIMALLNPHPSSWGWVQKMFPHHHFGLLWGRSSNPNLGQVFFLPFTKLFMIIFHLTSTLRSVHQTWPYWGP